MVWSDEEAGVLMDTVEKIGLFVVIWGEDDVVDDSFEDLCGAPLVYAIAS